MKVYANKYMGNQICELFALTDGAITHALGKTKEIIKQLLSK